MSEPKYIRKFGISPSMLNNFENCPAKFEGVSILKKSKYVETAANKWGNEVHTELELYVKEDKPVGSYLHHVLPVIDGLRKAGYKLYAEIPMSINRAWQAVGWWDRDSLTRGKADLLALKASERRAIFIDYKTGKRKRDDSQLNLYGSIALSALNLIRVDSWFLWLKSREFDKVVVTQKNVQILRNQFTTRFAAMDEAYRTGNFPTKPSPLCAYCPFLETCKDEGAALYRKKAKFIKGNRQT